MKDTHSAPKRPDRYSQSRGRGRRLLATSCWLLVGALASITTSCATSSRDRAWLGDELRERVGAGTRDGQAAELPPEVSLDDGLDEAEVTALALWRNPALQAELTRIDAARATLAEANTPANPQLTLLGALGPVTAVSALMAPLESLWQLPRRAKAAARDADSAAETVLMGALTLVRDVRLQHVELGLAVARAAIRQELAAIVTELGRISAARARLGDISPMDERLAAAEAQMADDARELANTEVVLASARLVAQLAIDSQVGPSLAAVFAAEVVKVPDLDGLLGIARALRPDVRAADFAIKAAMARAGWEERRIFSARAMIDAFWGPKSGTGQRVGLSFELPIFGANPGGIGRAEAEILRATALYQVARQNTILEVTAARARALQAQASRERFETEVLPALDGALNVAKARFETGDESYLVVLDVLRRVGDARLRHAELIADQRRAQSELERAIGARLVVAADIVTLSRDGQGTP